MSEKGIVDVIVGVQRGDEGKGRMVDMLAEDHDIIARFNGGHNAGHTIVLPDDREIDLHIIPSGITYDDKKNVIGNGTLFNPVKFVEEKGAIEAQGFEVSPRNLLISNAAHLVLPQYVFEDMIRENGQNAQGTTKSGIGPVTAQKAMREGVRAENINNQELKLYKKVVTGLNKQRRQRQRAGLDDINEKEVAEEFIEAARLVGPFVTDTVLFLGNELRKEKPARVLAEGAQGFLLDPDHGMYPYTTSTPTVAAAACIGLGVPTSMINERIGVVKLVPSHVGGGPFITEIHDETMLKRLHGDTSAPDAEFGTTTGRKRRLGNLDLAQIKRAHMVSDFSELALTKLDWVPRYGEVIRLCVAYVRKGKILEFAVDAGYKFEQCTPAYVDLPNWTEDISDVRIFDDLPENARNYVGIIEAVAGLPVKKIGVGPRRDQVIVRDAA